MKPEQKRRLRPIRQLALVGIVSLALSGAILSAYVGLEKLTDHEQTEDLGILFDSYQVNVVYVDPSLTDSSGNTPLFLARPGDEEAANDFSFATSVEVRQLDTNLLVATNAIGESALITPSDDSPVVVNLPFDPGSPVARIGANYYGTQDDAIVVLGPSGERSSHQIPIPEAGELTIDGAIPKGAGRASMPIAAAFASDSSGGVFAVVTNGVNSVVSTLDGRHRFELDGLGAINGAVTGPNGHIYILGRDGRTSGAPFTIVDFDPANLSAKEHDTGILPTSGHIASISLVTAGNKVVAYASQFSVGPEELSRAGSSSFPQHSKIAVLENGNIESRTLPDNSGLSVVSAPEGLLYIFGGPAQNRVTVWDIVSSDVRDVINGSPPDTYIVGVLSR